jgi:hypothetical protein
MASACIRNTRHVFKGTAFKDYTLIYSADMQPTSVIGTSVCTIAITARI